MGGSLAAGASVRLRAGTKQNKMAAQPQAPARPAPYMAASLVMGWLRVCRIPLPFGLWRLRHNTVKAACGSPGDRSGEQKPALA